MRWLLALLLCWSMGAWGATKYVRDAAACANNGNGAAYTCAASVGAAGAFRAAAGLAGDTSAAGDIYYWCGTHNINSSFQLAGTYESGSAGNPVILDGNCPVGDGTYDPGVVNAQGTQNYAFRLTTGGPDHWTIRNMTFRNAANDCMDFNLATATGWTVENVVVEDCVNDGLDVNAMADNGITLDGVTVYRAAQNGIVCDNSDGGRWRNLRVYDSGTSGAENNFDGIAINENCGDGKIIEDVAVFRQKSGLGASFDFQDSSGTGTATLRRAWLEGGEGSGYTATTTGGTGTTVAESVISIGHKHNVYLKDSAGHHYLRHFSTRDGITNEIKFGDTGTSGDSFAATVQNSIFCPSADTTSVAFWRDNATVTLTLENNLYCSGPFQTVTGGAALTFAQWKTATSSDASSIEADALLIADTMRITSSSPACAAGTYIPGLRDFDDLPMGYPADIGAFRCPGGDSPAPSYSGSMDGLFTWLIGLAGLLGLGHMMRGRHVSV